MRDEIERYRAANVAPFGINPRAVADHAEYARRLRLPFPLLADAGAGVARRYHAVVGDGARIVRTVYLIGQDGRIRFAAQGAPSAEIVLAAE